MDKYGKIRQRESAFNPEGIVSSSPRLARQRLPWVTGQQITNRNAVVTIPFSSGARVTLATTPSGLWFFSVVFPG